MYLLTIIWIIFRALIHSTHPGLYVKPHRNYYRLVQRDAYWPCLPWVLSFFNVFFSHHWLRRRSTKPALLYAILRNLKILVLKRRCVLDSFIGTINRHRSSLNNFTPQPRIFRLFSIIYYTALSRSESDVSRPSTTHCCIIFIFPIDDGQSSVQRESNPHLSGWVRRNCI